MTAIRVERHDRVSVITLDDPNRRNAFTPSLSAELAEAVTDCEQDDNVGAIVVTGQPPAFCAGADLTALGNAGADGLREIYAGFLAVAASTLPTVAAVNGPAVGAGLNLALACDVRVAGPRARFDARFLQLGLHPGGGMTWLLHNVVGPQTAAAMTIFGEVLDADQAVRAGLAWQSVDGEPTAVVNAAVRFAATAAAAPRDLVLTTKQTMRTTSVLDDHAAAVDIEIGPQLASMRTSAFVERLAAMKTKISRR